MKRGSSVFVLFFFVLFFVVVYADPAVARKACSTNPEQQAVKKSQVKTGKKVKRGVKKPKQVKRSGSLKTGVAKARTPKSRKTASKRIARVSQPASQKTLPDIKDNGEYIEYRLRRGETLEKVAARFNVDTDEIVDLNRAAKKRLRVGSVLFIPKVDEQSEDVPLVLDHRPLPPWRNAEEQGILVKVAKSFAGTPYKYGGDTVRGLDCSAFVKKMYEIFEVQLPRSAREQFRAGPRVDRDDLITGDLVFFRTKRYAKYPTHVGIYIGDDKFIHASSLLSRGVKIDRLSDSYFARTYTGAVRVKAPLPQTRSEIESSGGGKSSSS
jgi:LysM repeat protein